MIEFLAGWVLGFSVAWSMIWLTGVWFDVRMTRQEWRDKRAQQRRAKVVVLR